MRDESGIWQPRVKLSEQSIKISTPGILGARRFLDASGQFVADAIYEDGFEPDGDFWIVDPLDPIRRRKIGADLQSRELLEPAFRGGKRVREGETLSCARERAQAELSSLHPSSKRFVNPHTYPVGLEAGLHGRKMELIERLRG